MITGSHVVIFTQDAEADRAFFRDVLELPAMDAGGGWLLLALPPAEVACHPAERNDDHQLYLICDDLADTMAKLAIQGVGCEEPVEESWGTLTQIRLPGGGYLGLYQPKHPTAFEQNA